MANRQQNHQSGSQRYGNPRSSDEDDNRSARDYDRDYGQYGRRDSSEESGSTGRSGGFAGYGDFGQGDYDQPGRSANTGQNRYGQSGYGQQPNYGQDYGSSGTSNYGRSNFGSGRYERDESVSSGRGGAMGSRSGYGGYGGEGSYGSRGWSGQGSSGQGGWREPYGEGQRYGSSGEYSQGLHRGKGPKNFQRSDERVKELLCERLHDDPDIDASEVTVNVQGGKITLEGTVDSRRTKNAIEDVAEQFGTQEVQNNLRVQKQGERAGMESGGRSASNKASMSGEEGEQTRQKRN